MATKLGMQARGMFGKMHDKASQTRENHMDRAEQIGDYMQSRGLREIGDMKLKHVNGFMQEKMEDNLSTGTLSNYASTLRQMAEKMGKGDMIPSKNQEAFGFCRTEAEKMNPQVADREKINQVTEKLREMKDGEWRALAYEMQGAFGLRRKESALSVELKDGKLQVKGAKGGKPRELEATTAAQKDVYGRVKAYIADHKQKSLVPSNLTLKQGVNRLSSSVNRAGGTKANCANPHINRHAFAQDMKSEGKSGREISNTLGHNRDQSGHYVPED